MERNEKKEAIKALVLDMLNDSNKAMLGKLDRIIESGCIPVSDWNANHEPMIVPKSIMIALFESEAQQYSANGTKFEKMIKSLVRNIRCFF